MDLTEFLLARIAEDEAVARVALAWQRADPADRWRDDGGTLYDGQGAGMAGYVGDDVAPHIARWDPARVLAECEAKRQIVEAVQYLAGLPEGMVMPDRESAMGLERAMQAMGAVYADHPDYDPSWRP